MRRVELMCAKSKLTGFVLVLSVVLCAARTEATPADCQITFTDFAGRGTLTNFPAMVKLGPHIPGFTYGSFLSANGYDLRFWTNETLTGIEVKYEIEDWDTAGTSFVWVQVPELAHNGSIWASWGDPTYNSQAAYTTNGSVWSEDFRAVFHLNETVTDEQTTGIYDDSSPNDNSGTQTGTSVGTGVSAQCANFDGTGDFIRVANESDYDFIDTITASAWIRVDGGWNSNWQMFLTKGVDVGGWDMRRFNNTETISLCLQNQNKHGGDTTMADGQWHHLAATYRQSPTDARVYIDGQLYFTDPTPPATIGQNNDPLQISGRRADGSAWLNHRGLIDEVRVSQTYRSADWIWACWMNQGGNHDSFIAYGPVEAPGQPTLASATVTNITTTNALGGVILGGEEAYVTLFWGTADAQQTFGWHATNSTLASAMQPTGTISDVAISDIMVDTRYFYIFYASNNVTGKTAWSTLNQHFDTRLTGKSVTNLSAMTVNATEIELTWTDNFNTETGYIIQRSPDGSSWTNLMAMAADSSGYMDIGLSGESTYHYRIAATNALGLSDWSGPDQATTPARPNQIDTDFTEATFGDVGILRDVPNADLASITLDEANDRLVFATPGNTDMWGARNNAPIAYILKPDGPRWFMEAEVELATTGNQQVFGLTVYEDTDGANPDFTYGLDYWNPGTPKINLQGLGDNNPLVNVSAAGTTRVILRMLVEDNGGGPGVTRYTCKYDLLLGDGMQTLTTYDTSVTNARVGVALKTGNNGRIGYVHDLEIADIPAGQPLLSAQTVTNITTTTALGGVMLANTNANLTLFWGTNDAGTAFTWDATNALPAEQSVGAINGVALSNLVGDTTYYYVFYASNNVSGLAGWSDMNQSFDSGLSGLSLSDLAASAASEFRIDLTWTDSFNTETGYVVQRSPDGSSWATLGTAAAGASGYADATVAKSLTYHYRVAATNAVGLSDWSNVAQATTPAGTSDPNAPQHWWKLDEPSGFLARDSGLTGGMDGTLVRDGGGVGTLSWVTPANSRVGNALDYSYASGVSGGYVNAGDVSMTGTFTVNVWVDPNNVNDDWRFFAAKFRAGNRLFWVGQHADNGRMRYSISSDGANEIWLDSTGAVIGNHCWQMATVTWNETTKSRKLYVNGVLNAETNQVGVSLLTPRSSPFCIMNGYDTAGTLQYYGTADDVRVYDRELSPDEIRALYANPGAAAPALTIVGRDEFNGPELETGWTIDDREAADAHDLSSRPGWLRVAMAAGANTWLNSRDGAAMLYTDAPDGSFTMETRVDIATGNGDTPVVRSSGGIVVHDPSYVTAQFPFALYFWLGHNGTAISLSLQKPGGNLATAITGVSTHMYLKLYRDADAGTWVASYKVDAGDAWTEWVTVADGDLPNADVSDADIYVGTMTKTWGAGPANIDYDYFVIPEAPSTTGTVLLIR